jgi:hypothetical protein
MYWIHHFGFIDRGREFFENDKQCQWQEGKMLFYGHIGSTPGIEPLTKFRAISLPFPYIRPDKRILHQNYPSCNICSIPHP